MKMAHAKLIRMENGGVALSLVFRYVTCQIWVGVNVKFPEHVYDFAIVKMATLRSGRVRLSFSIDFDNYASKSAFGNRLEYIRSLLTPTGQRNLDNHGLMNAMFDLVEWAIPRSFPGSLQAPSSTVQSFNADAGK